MQIKSREKKNRRKLGRDGGALTEDEGIVGTQDEIGGQG